MKLPKLPYSLPRTQTEAIQFRGLNYTDNYADGALAESKNLSARRFPYISARRARSKIDEYYGISALTSWEKLVTVRDNKLYYGDVECAGELAPGEKQFAVINTKLVIFPDKKYVDLSTAIFESSNTTIAATNVSFRHNCLAIEMLNLPFSTGDSIEISGCNVVGNNKVVEISGKVTVPGIEKPMTILYVSDGTFEESEGESATITLQTMELALKPLGAEMSITGATFTSGSVGVSVNAASDLPFVVGDSITISGCVEDHNNKSVVIKSISYVPTLEQLDVILHFNGEVLKEANETGTITLTRAIPDLDYICESENRIWGCSNKDRTIYASALGDPTNFYNYEDGISTCSYAVAVGSEGDFTGCCKFGSSVLFFKNNTLHKMLGSYPAEYTMHSYKMDGVAPGCHKSMQVINETLIYVSEHGVCSYTGSSSSLLSSALEGKTFTDAVGGSDGIRYYLSAKEGEEYNLYTFDLKTGIWLHEDNTRVIDFARKGNALYFLDSEGDAYVADCGIEDKDVEWSAQFKPFYETTAGRKKHSQLLLRTELPPSSWMKIEVRFDGGRWREVGKIVSIEANTRPFTIPINRCDKFEIRLSGKGPFAVMNMLRKFSLGGAV